MRTFKNRPTTGEVLNVLRSEIEWYRNTYSEWDGTIGDRGALRIIKCLEEAKRRISARELTPSDSQSLGQT